VRKQRKGFSMLELVVAMAILAIALAVAIPSIQGLIGDTPVRAAADMVKSRWAEARAKAMDEGKPYRFQVIDNTHFRYAPDDDFDGTGGVNDELPRDVSFGTPQANATTNQNNVPSDGSLSIVFLPDGTATTDVELPLNGQNGPPLTLKLNKSTGVTDVSR